jgi:hypothetical protein
MNGWLNIEVARERRKELLREADRRRLARRLREARKARTEDLFAEETSEPVRNIEVRWGLAEDEPRIAELLELNGMLRRAAFEERFIVAEEDGEILAALCYRTASKRLLLGLLVADPWAGERALAVALYAGAEDLARELGVWQIRAWSDRRADYPREAGYSCRIDGWRLDTTQPFVGRMELPTGGWRRAIALFGAPAVPFFRAFRG